MYKLLLITRYLLKRKLTYFAVAAVTLCVFVVLVVVTILTGLTRDFKRNAYLTVGDCVIDSPSLVGFPYYEELLDELKQLENVQAASPVIKTYGMVRAFLNNEMKPRTTRSAEVFGVDPEAHTKVTGWQNWLHYHGDDVSKSFNVAYDPCLPGCVPGIAWLYGRNEEGVYETTSWLPRARFEITAVPLTATGALAKAGASEVSAKTFYLSDFSQTGIRNDWLAIYVPFEDAQQLCGMQTNPKRTHAIFIKYKEGANPQRAITEVRRMWKNFLATHGHKPHASLLNNVRIRNWKMFNSEIIGAAQTQQTMMIFCFAMLGVITVFIVFVVFFVLINRKSKDIGILKSVGASNTSVLTMFVCFALLIAVIGSLLGSLGGWQFLKHFNALEDWCYENYGIQLFDRSIYAIGDIPTEIETNVLLIVSFSAVAACLLGAFLPSRRAMKMTITETLQVTQI